MKDFINIVDYPIEQLQMLLDKAIADKALLAAGKLPRTQEAKTLAMIFEKPSLRTRVSFETGMTQLGGHAIYLAPADIGLGTREPVKDVARVIGRMCDCIMARTFSHKTVELLGKFSSTPVINGLSDLSHPCQAMADFMTIIEQFGSVEGKTIAFIGDGNNVAHSLAVLAAKLGAKFILACPEGYELPDETTRLVTQIDPGAEFSITNSAADAVTAADVVYADTWVSMGQEEEKAKRVKDFEGYQINAELMNNAKDETIVLHCLPAYRDYEITDEVFEANAEPIFREAENRLHFQRSLMDHLM